MLIIRDYLLALRTSKVSFGKEFILVLVSVIDLVVRDSQGIKAVEREESCRNS